MNDYRRKGSFDHDVNERLSDIFHQTRVSGGLVDELITHIREQDKTIFALHDKLDKIIDFLYEGSLDSVKKLLLDERGKDRFCSYCFYSDNGVLDRSCGRVDCERFI